MKSRSVHVKTSSVHVKTSSVHVKTSSVHAKSCGHRTNSHYFVLDLTQFLLKFSHFVPYLTRFCANERAKKMHTKKLAQKIPHSKTRAIPNNAGAHLIFVFLSIFIFYICR